MEENNRDVLVHRNRLPTLNSCIKGKCNALCIILLYAFPSSGYCTGSGVPCPSEINSKWNKSYWKDWEKHTATRG